MGEELTRIHPTQYRAQSSRVAEKLGLRRGIFPEDVVLLCGTGYLKESLESGWNHTTVPWPVHRSDPIAIGQRYLALDNVEELAQVRWIHDSPRPDLARPETGV